MSSKESKRKIHSKTNYTIGEKEINPKTAKIVLFVFGLGPLLLMCLFLFSNGFFKAPG
tara:strand:+ start:442 stop:615 length:174 start_codon:yes stop_codon:yes gene_type:complete